MHVGAIAEKGSPELVRGLNVWHSISIVAGNDYRQRNLSGARRDDAGRRNGQAGLSGVDRRWTAFVFWRAHLCGAGRSASVFRRGIRLRARRVRTLAGFLYGWTWFLIAKPGSIATITAAIVRVLGTFTAFSFLSHAIFALHVTSTRTLVFNYGHLVAIAAAVLITALNYVGVRKAGDFQFAFTVLKVFMIVGIAVVALTASSGSWSNFGTTFAGAKGGMAGFMAALVAALWAYDGWNDLNMVSEEIQRPEKTIPIALIAGVGLVAVLYMGLNAGIQRALPATAIAQAAVPAAAASEAALGHWGDCSSRLE